MTPDTPPLSAWLEAHGLRYGVAGYWDASVTTVESDNKVQLRAVDLHPHAAAPRWTVDIPGWESNPLWYTRPPTTRPSRSPTCAAAPTGTPGIR
jgi:hypothetical protein